jgi:hypothetical protein
MIAAASGGIVASFRGVTPRVWLLHGVAVVLAAASYVLALGIAETA